MRAAVLITATHANTGLYLTSDMTFYATECLPDQFHDRIISMHEKQITTETYADFADYLTDRYKLLGGGGDTLDQLVVCGALAGAHYGMRRWFLSAKMTAYNIYLKTINATNETSWSRIVPHDLADMRITAPEAINGDVLWRILTSEPWLTYAERCRAQHNRMAKVLGTGRIDRLPKTLAKLVDMDEPVREPESLKAIHKSIKRAYKLNTSLFGATNLRLLLSGKIVTLQGHHYDYDLSIDQGDLIRYTKNRQTGTAPIHVTVINKQGARLCSMCVYFENISLIDHLIALTLHLKSAATEMDILRTAQVQITTKAFYDDPMLPDLKGLHDPVTGPLTTVDTILRHSQYDPHHQSLTAMIGDMKPEWLMLAESLTGYTPELIDILMETREFSPWTFAGVDAESLPSLTRAKNYFGAA